MGTTSTVPVVTPVLLAALNAGLPVGVDAFEAWPGPDAAPEMVVLGDIEWDDYAIATIKSGRKQRQEDWSIGFEVFVFGTPGSTPADPATARTRAFVLNAAIEDTLADDPLLGLATGTVQRIEARPTEAGPRVFEKGWAYRVAGRIEVHARLL